MFEGSDMNMIIAGINVAPRETGLLGLIKLKNKIGESDVKFN